MKISMKGDYAFRALIDLARRYGQGPTQAAEIASRQGVPEPFLDQVLADLRRAGFIRSVRGPQGGHYLVQAPEKITVTQVILALEGSLAPIDCLDDASRCARAPTCVQWEVWQRVKDAAQAITDGVTIQELARKQAAQESRAMYHI